MAKLRSFGWEPEHVSKKILHTGWRATQRLQSRSKGFVLPYCRLVSSACFSNSECTSASLPSLAKPRNFLHNQFSLLPLPVFAYKIGFVSGPLLLSRTILRHHFIAAPTTQFLIEGLNV
jgi:hypothetical protein